MTTSPSTSVTIPLARLAASARGRASATGEQTRRARPVRTVLVDNFLCLRKGDAIAVDVVPHLGLATLATVLERAGHEVSIFDPKLHFGRGNWPLPDASFLDSWANEILRRDADVVGFTAYGRSLPYAVRVAERLKRAAPSRPIVLGGPHATIVGERILAEFDCIDVVVRYEAEPTIVALVEALAAREVPADIPGLLYREGGAVRATPPLSTLPEMDELPPPALHLYPLGSLPLPELSIEAGRGCPFSCTFCSTATFFRRRYRMKSSARMVDEMEEARARWGISTFSLNHDLFGLVKKNLLEFCRLVEGRGFRWNCSMRTDTLDESLIDDLARAGCTHIFFGIESGSPRLQRVMEKRLDVAASRSVVAKVVRAGMTCTTSFIVGFPDEAEADQDLTLDLLGDLLRIDPGRVRPQLHVLSPEPGSALAAGEPAIAFDGIGPEADEVIDDALIRSNPALFSVFYHYHSTLPRWRQVLSSAFVAQLLPELGYYLATHMFSRFYGGSLARMFAAIVPADPGELSFDRIMGTLRQGVDAEVRRLAGEAPYLGDMVRLGRALRAVDPLTAPLTRGADPCDEGEDEGEDDREDEGPGATAGADGPAGALDGQRRAWLIRFGVDVESIVQTMLRDPCAPLPPGAARPADRWWVVYRAAPGQDLALGSLSPDAARELAREGSTVSERSDLWRGLDLTLVAC